MDKAKIIATGSYLPQKVLTNGDLSQMVDTSDEWIKERTGITCRHLVDEGETTSDLAVAASQQALAQAKMSPAQLEAIIVATTTPDMTFPATATIVQRKLGLTDKVFAFDIQAVCSGFIYALSMANSLIISGQVQNVLVIGADAMSKIVNWQDRNTCVLFGDGAGAVILAKSTTDSGILGSKLHSDGNTDLLYTTGGVATNQQVGTIFMEGKEVFRQATNKMSSCVQEVLTAHQLTVDDVDWLIPHQANQRIISAVAKKIALPMEKVILTIAEQANTSAGSIPLALDYANHRHLLSAGQLIVLEALGGGLTWGSILLRW